MDGTSERGLGADVPGWNRRAMACMTVGESLWSRNADDGGRQMFGWTSPPHSGFLLTILAFLDVPRNVCRSAWGRVGIITSPDAAAEIHQFASLVSALIC